ncbi:MAG: spore germination protein [Eubacteriales bacterium]
MLSYFRRILAYYKSGTPSPNGYKVPDSAKLSDKVDDNRDVISELLGGSGDVKTRTFAMGVPPVAALLIFIDGLVDNNTVNNSIIRPLMQSGRDIKESEEKHYSIEHIKDTLVTAGDVSETDSLKKTMEGCLSGNAALFVEGCGKCMLINCRGWEKRSISEPSSESIIRGPRESFVESLSVNVALLRRKIKDPSLVFEYMVIGERTKTDVSVAYIKDIAENQVVKNIKDRLKKIRTDAILESGYIEQFIQDAPFSIFSTTSYTEKPDVVAAKLLEGRIAIFVDGTPFVLTAPMLFLENFQTSEDYYINFYYASLLRLLRFLSYTITLLAPAAYVALTTFHQELLPTSLLFSMIAAREGVPFPAVIEALLMLITFEIIREAGLRLPRPIGQTISIVGALVIGDAAVAAGLIGAPMVIVVAFTAISSFVVPSCLDNSTIMRLILLVLSGMMGLFGIMIGLLGLIIHLASLDSFGSPYLSPIAPVRAGDQKDTFVRFPLWMMKKRPYDITAKNKTRQSKDSYWENGSGG